MSQILRHTYIHAYIHTYYSFKAGAGKSEIVTSCMWRSLTLTRQIVVGQEGTQLVGYLSGNNDPINLASINYIVNGLTTTQD